MLTLIIVLCPYPKRTKLLSTLYIAIQSEGCCINSAIAAILSSAGLSL